MNLFSKKSNIFIFILLFIGYIFLNILLSGFYNTIPLIIAYASALNWFKIGISLLLTFVIGVLVALNGVLVYIKYQERKQCKEGVALASVGSAGGLVVGVCPLCITGIFPLALSFLGISFSFASLPFKGIEIQLLTIIILFASFFILKDKNHQRKVLK